MKDEEKEWRKDQREKGEKKEGRGKGEKEGGEKGLKRVGGERRGRKRGEQWVVLVNDELQTQLVMPQSKLTKARGLGWSPSTLNEHSSKGRHELMAKNPP